MTRIDARTLMRRGGWSVAAARTALGLTVMVSPSGAARPWVGAAADGVAGRVFGRALGGRDLALGLGALSALRQLDAEPGPARAWVALGALSDCVDVAATLSAWRQLPRVGRLLVLAASAGAAVAGVAGALAIHPGD